MNALCQIRKLVVTAILLLLTLTAVPAVGAEDAPESESRALPTAIAVVPGFVVHGAGHFAAGDSETAWKLLGAEAASIGLAVGGIAGLAVTGAADETVSVFAATTAMGGTSFFFSWFADIYGVATPDGGLGLAETRSSPLSASLGYQYVYDPVFDYAHFQHASVGGRLDRLGLRADNWLALDDDNWAVRGEASWRFLGPLPDEAFADGSFLDLEAGVIYHDYNSEAFATLTGELTVHGRLDLHHYTEALRGSFVDLDVGAALVEYAYDDHEDDVSSLLLFDAGFGMYLGRSEQGWGELEVFYSHRHDGFAGGGKLIGLGSGAPGSAGVRMTKSVAAPWGVAASFEAGSAYVGTLDLVYRPGGSR